MAPLHIIQLTAFMCLILSFGLTLSFILGKKTSLVWYLILLFFAGAIFSQTLAIQKRNYIYSEVQSK